MKVIILTNNKPTLFNGDTINVKTFNNTDLMCCVEADLIIIDKEFNLTEKDEDVLFSIVFDGSNQTGTIINLKDYGRRNS